MKSLSSQEQTALMEKFTRYEEAMQKYCQRKNVNRNTFDKLMEKVTKVFQDIDEAILTDFRNSIESLTHHESSI